MATAHSSSASVKSGERLVDPEKTASVTEEPGFAEKFEGLSDNASEVNPLAQFSDDEIKRTWRKVDWHILPVAVLLYLSSYIDRYVWHCLYRYSLGDLSTAPVNSANIGNAKVLGLATSLKLTSNQYNLALSIFFVGYVVFETPSNVIVKRTGPRWYIPIMTVSASICCARSKN